MFVDHVRRNPVPLGGFEKKKPFPWANLLFVAAVSLSFIILVSVFLNTPMRLLNSPIYVGEYESIWFLDENTTTFSNDSYDYNINSTIWLSEDLFAVTVVPPGVSSDSDHPFVRSVPLLLRGLTLDALTLWVGWVLVVASLVQVLIVVFERRLFVCCHDGDDDDDGDDDYLDALEPPPAVGVDADGDALVGAVMMQLRNAIALQLHLRGLMADDDGDVFLDAAVGADRDE